MSTSKRLVYKIARFSKEQPGKNLQDLLAQALKKRKAALDRQQPGDSENQFSLINYHGPHKGMRVGEFFDYTHGQHQPIAKFEKSSDALQLTTLKPDDESDFVHSIMYFGVRENHVILSQSISLRVSHFEAYVNWLLSETDILAEGEFVSLIDCIPEDKAVDIQTTKGIEFHAPVNFQPVQKEPKKKVAEEATTSIAYKPKDLGWELLKRILPSEFEFPTEIQGDQLVANSDLEVTLYLSWTKQRKSDPTDLLDQLSNQLRHVDTELDYTIHTKSGTITKSEIKLSKLVSVGVDKFGLVKKSDMWERIATWLQSLSDEGRVPPLN